MKISKLCLLALLVFSISLCAQRLPNTAVPDHYTLKLQPNFDTYKFTGDEAIDVHLTQPTSSITLNAVDIAFGQVIVSAGGKTQTATVKIDAPAETATFTVPQQIPAGKAHIRVQYTGELNDKLRGFYRSTAQGLKYAVTQFEPTDARRAFPSFDEPAYKATFDISVTAPQDDMVISNGNVLSDTAAGVGKHTVTFATSPRMSTYLVAVLVGQFECLSGSADNIPVRVCTVPGQKRLGEFALTWAQDILTFYDQYYGIRYPFGKLDLIGIPDFEAGAMENTAAITFRDQDLLLDPKTATLDQQKNVASVIAHEMAHQWFGDLVTMKWWDDIWLNEGFATWMQTKPLAALRPEWSIPQDEQDSALAAMRVDSLESTRPIRTNAETTAQINELFDAIAYNKTAAVLRMVENYISPEVFRQGVNQYLQSHAYNNATAEDFWTKVAQVSKKPVDQIMKSYVDQSGLPMVSMSCSNGHTTLTQKRFFIAASANQSANQVWTIPVCTKAVGAPAESCQLLSKPTETIGSSSCNDKLNQNADAKGYYRSGYTQEQLSALAPVIESSFTPAERLLILANEWALARSGQHQIRGYLDLAQALSSDRTHAVWDDISHSMRFLDEEVVSDSDKPAYQARIRTLASPVMQELGWKSKPTDSYDIDSVRASAFYLLGYVGRDPQAMNQARAIVEAYIKDPTSTDPMLSRPAFEIAASNGDAALYDKILATMPKASAPDVYYRLMFSLAQFRDSALIRRTLDFALSDKVRSQDMPILFAQLLGNPASRDTTWQFIRSHWPQLAQRSTVWGTESIVRSTSAFCDTKTAGDVQQFFTQHPVPQANRTLKQALENIDNCSSFRSAQQASLAAWVSSATPVTRGQ